MQTYAAGRPVMAVNQRLPILSSCPAGEIVSKLTNLEMINDDHLVLKERSYRFKVFTILCAIEIDYQAIEVDYHINNSGFIIFVKTTARLKSLIFTDNIVGEIVR